MKDNYNSRRFKTGQPERSRVRPMSKASNPKLVSNYETMLRLYLITKEQSLSKKELKYTKLDSVEKVGKTREVISSAWNNILQVVQKANQLISSVRPGVSMVTD
jgi:hypothetical protein